MLISPKSLSSPSLTEVPGHPPCPAWPPAPPNYLLSQQASDCSRAAATLSQAPQQMNPVCREGHQGAAEKTGEGVREEGRRRSLFFIWLSKVKTFVVAEKDRGLEESSLQRR